MEAILEGKYFLGQKQKKNQMLKIFLRGRIKIRSKIAKILEAEAESEAKYFFSLEAEIDVKRKSLCLGALL